MNTRTVRRWAYEADASEYLQIPMPTLRGWRQRGVGPRFYKIGGRVRYDLDDLDAWIAAQASDARKAC